MSQEPPELLVPWTISELLKAVCSRPSLSSPRSFMGDIAIASFQVMQVFNTSVKMTPGDPLNDGLLGNEQRFKISWVAGAAGDVIESLGKLTCRLQAPMCRLQ
ncbi:hypothetical protein IAQ61_011614 [Plenodomus lingam]|uniref:uncharacterized protein n=1 Tax=Leptosphaeria maculans TaxID=5022 RepID=UPI00332A2246|nr:hypothetical protein IAQ61_011614 [Plenodomus lingam]